MKSQLLKTLRIYDCTMGIPSWQSLWSQSKKVWYLGCGKFRGKKTTKTPRGSRTSKKRWKLQLGNLQKNSVVPIVYVPCFYFSRAVRCQVTSMFGCFRVGWRIIVWLFFITFGLKLCVEKCWEVERCVFVVPLSWICFHGKNSPQDANISHVCFVCFFFEPKKHFPSNSDLEGLC